MEEQWQIDRARLRRLRQEHADWSYRQLAAEMGYSERWVKKWLKRFKGADPTDTGVLRSQSRRPKRAGSPLTQAVIERILQIRDEPPVYRTPGPLTLKYFLHQQEKTQPMSAYLPRSTSTIWRILTENQRIQRPASREREPLETTEPLQVWQIDFKDVTTVKVESEAKRQHLVETLNIVDTGTSILVDNPARLDFTAETVIRTLAELLQQRGCPGQISFDRDPRFVASASGADFPALFVRFLTCLGIQPDICPPRRPQHNGYVERYKRTYKYEAILVYRPETFEQVRDMNLDTKHHYNYQRPHQAPHCGNRPPCLAFPQLPTLPERVDPDRWLEPLAGHQFKRRVRVGGTVQVDKFKYYIGRAYQGRWVILQVDALNRQFQVELAQAPLKTLPIKGLQQGSMTFEAYLDFICEQARSNWRLYIQKRRQSLPLAA